MEETSILILDSVTAEYRRSRWLIGQRSANPTIAVDNVSFSMSRGEVLGLIGESGSGKTTIGRVAAGLLRPASGTVRLAGEQVGILRERSISQRQAVQMVFQDPYSSLNPHMTPREAVAEVLRYRLRVSHSEAHDVAAETLEKVRLPSGAMDTRPRRLSGGQRQRVSIARALAGNPDVLIADEPTSSLDASVRSSVIGLLRSLASNLNLAILMITHDISSVTFLCDRVIVMRRGRMVEQGPTAEVLKKPSHPYTQTLINATPTLPMVDTSFIDGLSPNEVTTSKEAI